MRPRRRGSPFPPAASIRPSLLLLIRRVAPDFYGCAALHPFGRITNIYHCIRAAESMSVSQPTYEPTTPARTEGKAANPGVRCAAPHRTIEFPRAVER